jgi:hypothetical protein
MIVVAVAALLLTGCEGPEGPPAPAPAPAPEPVLTDSPSSPPATADGSVLAFLDASGVVKATLGCSADGLRIALPMVQPIASEERLSIGTDGEAWALVADLSATGPGVTASGPPDPDLLDRLERGEALFASYGSQSVGPLVAASPDGLQTMISGCRQQE